LEIEEKKMQALIMGIIMLGTSISILASDARGPAATLAAGAAIVAMVAVVAAVARMGR